MIIAVDFDGTIEINGHANATLISQLAQRQRRGDIIILWSCRSGKSLHDAVEFMRQNGICPNYVNQNAPSAVAMLGHDSRKIYADIYIDDKGRMP